MSFNLKRKKKCLKGKKKKYYVSNYMRRIYVIESFSYSPSDHSTLECLSLQKMDIVGDLEKIEPKSFLRLVWQLTFSTFKSTFSNILSRLDKSSGKSWMHFNGKLENDDITSTLLHIFI